jgi:hypothetical protein
VVETGVVEALVVATAAEAEVPDQVALPSANSATPAKNLSFRARPGIQFAIIKNPANAGFLIE